MLTQFQWILSILCHDWNDGKIEFIVLYWVWNWCATYTHTQFPVIEILLCEKLQPAADLRSGYCIVHCAATENCDLQMPYVEITAIVNVIQHNSEESLAKPLFEHSLKKLMSVQFRKLCAHNHFMRDKKKSINNSIFEKQNSIEVIIETSTTSL